MTLLYALTLAVSLLGVGHGQRFLIINALLCLALLDTHPHGRTVVAAGGSILIISTLSLILFSSRHLPEVPLPVNARPRLTPGVMRFLALCVVAASGISMGVFSAEGAALCIIFIGVLSLTLQSIVVKLTGLTCALNGLITLAVLAGDDPLIYISVGIWAGLLTVTRLIRHRVIPRNEAIRNHG